LVRGKTEGRRKVEVERGEIRGKTDKQAQTPGARHRATAARHTYTNNVELEVVA
jgi:hypothetical protein